MVAVELLPPKLIFFVVSFRFTISPILAPDTASTLILTICNCRVGGKKEASKPSENPSLASIPPPAPPRTPIFPSLALSIPAWVSIAP